MTDQTKLFKATVQTIKARNKARGVNVAPDKSILGKPQKATSEFATKAKDVVTNITKLKEFLMEHRREYINAASLLGSDVSRMTDAERDQIDSEAQKFIKTCLEAIKVFRLHASSDKVLPQVKEHRDAVLSLIDGYLKAVCQIYSEQRAVRVKRVVDRKRMGRLEPEGKKQKWSTMIESDRKDGEKGAMDAEGKSETSDKEKAAKYVKSTAPVDEPPIVFHDDDDELSPEEAQMFEQENQQLYEEMNSMVDEVRNIEGKVVEITRLQEIFADKVLEQDQDINRIADKVVGTTENIKEANEEIREAMKNNAGLRVWILFFLIVCSFSLLFLDWYNA